MFSYNKIFMISQKQLNGKKNIQFVNDSSLTAELRGRSTLPHLPFLVSSCCPPYADLSGHKLIEFSVST